ncbi:hypothetical protein [Deinococcus sp. UYEF24]
MSRGRHQHRHQNRARAAMLTFTAALSAALSVGASNAQERAPVPAAADGVPSSIAVPGDRQVTLNVRTPTSAARTLVFQALPTDLTFVPGSVTLDGQAAPDPLIGADGLYFELSGAASGTLAFSVTGPESGALPLAGLRVRYPQGQSETLQGTFDEAAFARANPVTAPVAERAGVIRSPQDGLVLSARRSVNVTVDVPAGQDPAGALSVNGQPVPDTQIGTRTLFSDGHTRLEYVAVPLEVGDNTLTALSDTVHVRTAGAAAKLRLIPATGNVADGSTPLNFAVEVQDAQGNAADLPSVSVTVTGSEPVGTDADLNQSGYQVSLQNGKGALSLRPLTLPGTVTLTFDVNGHTQVVTAQVRGDRSRLLIAHSGVTLSAGEASFQGAASIETPVLDGKLYVAANSQGVNQEARPFARYPAYGDSSVNAQPLRAQGKVAARLVLPRGHAEYGQDAAVDPVFGIQTGADELNAETNGQTRAGFSLTQVPGDQQSKVLTPDGTRILRLPTSPISGSETVILVTSKAGIEVGRKTLSRGLNYVLSDDRLLEFPAPLLPVDASGQDVRLLVTYRSGTSTASTLAAGVHLTHDLKAMNGETEVTFGTLSAGAVLNGSVLSVGVHANVTLPQSGNTQNTVTQGNVLRSEPSGGADVLIAASGGALYGTVSAAYQAARLQATLGARYEGAGYTGPGAGSPGFNVNVGALYSVSETFGVKLSVTGNRQDVTTLTGLPGVGTGLEGLTPAPEMDLVAAGGVSYRQGPFTVDLLLRRNFSAAGFGVQGSVAYSSGATELSVTHAQDFGAGQSLSTLTASTALAGDLRLGFSVDRDWNTGLTRGGLTLSGVRGGVNYVAGYDLPSEGGTLGRARLGATTSIPLAPGLSTDLAASVSTGTGLTGSLGGTLRYTDTAAQPEGNGYAGTQASLGADASLSPTGTKFDVKSAINVSYGQQWTLAADGLSEFVSGTQGGNRYGLGLAWRGENAAALGYLRFRNGSFGEQRVTGELELEQRPDFRSQERRLNDAQDYARKYALNPLSPPTPARAQLELRESLALSVPLGEGAVSPTVQGLAGARYWFTDTFALGLGTGVAYQSGSALGSRLGLEASIVPLSGLMLTAGYNILGFTSDLGSQPTRPGAYLKVDLLIDELRK